MPFLRRSGLWDLVAQDRLLESLEFLARLKTEIIVEKAARASVRGKCVGLALRAVERKHQVTPQALSVRVIADESFQLVNQFGVLPEGEIHIDPILECRDAKIDETLGFGPERPIVADAGVRRAAPQLQGPAQSRCGATGSAALQRLPALSHQPLEPPRIDPIGGGGERVTRRGARDRGVRADDPS